MTRIDVVIPTWNRCALLPRAIASIQTQTLPVARIIVVDDGSTDGTLDWLNREAAKDTRIVVTPMNHSGASRARNAGIEQADAEWIAFLDSDDTWEPDKLERQAALLQSRPDLVGLFCGFRIVDADREVIHLPRDAPSLLDLRCSNVLGSTSGAVVRRAALAAMDGFNPALPSCQDWDAWLRLRKIGTLGVVRLPLVRFNCGQHERISTTMHKVLGGHRALFPHLLSGADHAGERAVIRAHHMLVEADIARRFGDYSMAARLIARSLWQVPGKAGVAAAWRTLRDAWHDTALSPAASVST